MTPASPGPVRRPTTRYAVLVWGTAVVAYVVAVLHRSSLGVAGIEASDRFGTGASTLATFVVVQLVVYAGLQVPVGVLLDRVGPRLLVAAGALLMSVGQVVIALATTVELAVVARVLVGAGDALTFVSVVRLVPSWFSLRRVPLVTQLTGIAGLLGQLLAAVPLVLALHARGWTTAFTGVAAAGVVAALAVLVVVRDAPDATGAGPDTWRMRTVRAAEPVDAVPLAELTASGPEAGEVAVPVEPGRGPLAATLREPGTWLGFWVHFVSAYSNNAMVLLWASPFLLSGQGRTPREVSGLLAVNVGAAVVAGPLIGQLSGRHPRRRLTLVGVVVGAIGLAWVGLLLPTAPLPLWALGAFLAVVAVGGPTSLVGLDIARAHNPRSRMGTATGFANSGGFLAGLVTIWAIGLVLDARGGGGTGVAYPLADYRAALLSALAVWLVGVVGLVVAARRLRAAGPGPLPTPG